VPGLRRDHGRHDLPRFDDIVTALVAQRYFPMHSPWGWDDVLGDGRSVPGG
jgi:hypothetical protein